ncbi:gamma-glutamyl-gamma-aminobutyrate hydrolase family protein [Cytobacillus sp. NCCP-133]|nr:gamma-glutamyl-gamma-aminobutyrate hydrolase family protein [Cytobacillus sp. NCCP-133]
MPENFEVCAAASDGVIEAFESKNMPLYWVCNGTLHV